MSRTALLSRSRRVTALAGVGALAATICLPGLAVAADTVATPDRVASGVDRGDDESTLFAGYISPLGKDKRIIGTYTLPTLDCGGRDEATASVIELATAGGGDWVDGLVFSNCVAGVGSHDAVFHTNTADGVVDIAEEVSDGDKIKVESVYKKGKIKVTMTNLTRDWTAKGTFSGFEPVEASALAYSVELGEGEPSLPPLSEDSSVEGVKVGGKDLKDTKPTKYDWVDEDGSKLVKPSKITKGTNFKLNYVG